ncbi:MAG: signal recognition particle-docking protein FtsY, partial [Gammaproteobacteria bacterium]|nr:signal recognition particle-docking protein FtsY [Gammaproteobacteria bacterium]
MFGFGIKDKSKVDATAVADQPEKQGIISQLKQRLARTRHNLTDGLANLLLGQKEIDEDLLEELETLLLLADVGVDATSRI